MIEITDTFPAVPGAPWKKSQPPAKRMSGVSPLSAFAQVAEEEGFHEIGKVFRMADAERGMDRGLTTAENIEKGQVFKKDTVSEMR